MNNENQLVVLSDDHVRVEEPFFTSKKLFFDWVLEQPWNNDTNVLLHCGDLFHSNLPNPKEIDLVIDFLSKSKFKEITLMAGNGAHEFFRPKKSYAIDSLTNIDHVVLVKKPSWHRINNTSVLLLPWVPNRFYEGIESMKAYYEKLPHEIANREYNFVFGHFAARQFFESEINVDYLSGEHRMGHIHPPDDMYLGASTITRKDEAGLDYFVNLIDTVEITERREPIPRFLDYEKVTYPAIPPVGIFPRIYEVFDAPSAEVAREHYKGYFLHSIHTVATKNPSGGSGDSEGVSLSLIEHMDNFIQDKGISPELGDKLRSLIKEVE